MEKRVTRLLDLHRGYQLLSYEREPIVPKTALLLIDHGSRSDVANRTLDDFSELLERMRPDLIVRHAHMELAEPTIEQGVDACVRAGATEVVAHPYMLAPGRHATRDIPAMVSAVAARHPSVRVRVTEPLGLHEKIGQVVLERAGL